MGSATTDLVTTEVTTAGTWVNLTTLMAVLVLLTVFVIVTGALVTSLVIDTVRTTSLRAVCVLTNVAAGTTRTSAGAVTKRVAVVGTQWFVTGGR